MTVEKYLTHRGEIRAAVGVGGVVAFVTTHPEGRATGLYRLDADRLAIEAEPLPAGGTAIVADGGSLWLAGGDGQVYEAPADSGPPRPIGPRLDAPASALAPLADGRLAALVGSNLVVLSRKGGKPLQVLELPEAGTALAADPTGRWLAAGTARGTVAVFDAEDKAEFLLGSSGKLHEGAVTALLFEADDLRFFSAGADLKLLSTHARGTLEPEDKGRANNHADVVTALLLGPGDRLYSGSRDGSIKSWPRAGAVKPATIRDGVGKVVALALVSVHDRPRLGAACEDGTLRFFPVDAAGKLGELSHRAHDALASAEHELAQDDAPRRQAALEALAGYDDLRSVERIAGQAVADPDHALRLLATERLAASAHPRAAKLLESGLAHADEAVRVAAFRGLRKALGESSLHPIELALKAGKADVGRLAVEALAPMARGDDLALARLVGALDANTPEVRLAALIGLESAYASTSAQADLLALDSKHADVRRAALVRLHRRQLLDDPAVAMALRRRAEDADPEVRRAAFLLALHARPRLLEALRSRDPELARQLAELEGTGPDPSAAEKAAAKEKEPRKKPAKAAATPAPAGLEDLDLEPLLHATASQALDTGLRGARGLAVLGDPRAFGLLLQLSREEDKAARAEVCRAMAALDDPRAAERLRSMLHDPEPEVRDAAFTAMARIHQAEPLLAAESGLNASHEDVRRRGLQALVAEARKGPPSDAARDLLARALNDSFPAVRSEAFKSTIALKVGGTGASALRLAARSLHADVRREVLNEAMARVEEPQGWDLVLESFNDPDPALRADAFAFAVKKTKGLEFLDAALGSRFADLRLKAVEGLVKKHTAAAQALLARALDDEDREVRLAALASLVDADAIPALADALANPHPDVRVRAARALAAHGDPRAFGPLMALVTAPYPEQKERRADWLALAESALDGLGELGDPAAVPDLIPPLDSPHPELRKQAARALARVCRPEDADALRQALRHADPEVKYRAAAGLARLGDPSMASLVFSEAAAKVISPEARVAAALGLGPAGEDRLVVLLDDPKDEVRARALLLLMAREWKDPTGTAARCLACLSSRTPRIRLTAARALEALAEPGRFAGFVAGLVNDRGDKPAWKVPEATVDDLAEMLAHGDPQIRDRAARLLRHLDADTQDAFDQAWKVHQARFARELADLRDRAARRPPVPSRYSPAELRDLAFGAYVGLARHQQQGPKGPSAPWAAMAMRARLSALAHLRALAEADPRHARAARPVLVQALGDSNQGIRVEAFEQALALGMPAADLAAEALATGHVDLGVRGLELLAGGATEEAGQAVLERAMLARKDGLAAEAARLLIARRGAVAVASRALEAANEGVRQQAVGWLAAASDDPAARDRLRAALGSRHRTVREAAALALATIKDPAAFEALVALLGSATLPFPQGRLIQALADLGDPRTPDALLDRLVNDPAGTARADDLLRAVGRFRRPEVADRLLALVENDPKRRESAFAALLKISGHDQPIVDPEGDRPDDRWEREQFPRLDDLLARMLDRLSAPGDARLLARLIPGARWARGKAVDPPLAALANHPDDPTRHAVIEALAWRLRKREGDAEPLRRALGHRDPVTQFLAAEGLARAGRPDGLNVLMASIDFATDLGHRRRAVLALGELADERAFETLLKLAREDGHALQEPASEAIGHLGRSPRADDAFRILERQARDDTRVGLAALQGLRWLDTRAGWELIRRRAADPHYPFLADAIELLGHHDDPATRDFLLRILASARKAGLEEAMAAARRLFGPDSLEPDYAALQGETAWMLDEEEILGRVRDRGEPARIFAILPRCSDSARASLREALLCRPDLPVAEAKAALDGPGPNVTGLAARVLGRAGTKAAGAGPALESALGRWLAAWVEKRSARPSRPGDPALPLTDCVRDLVWAAGRLGVARGLLPEIAGGRPGDPAYRTIRREAVLAMASGPATPEALGALESAASTGDPEVRAIAARAIARLDPARASGLAGRSLPDRVAFRGLTLDGKGGAVEALRAAAREVHTQGMALPGLIDVGDVATLAAVAGDRSLPEGARLGAIEGLGAMALEPAEAVLRRVGSDESVAEELRKAAWRSLRRSRRAREKAAKGRAEVTP